MQNAQHFRRGEMLLSQGRPELAERELRQHLAQNPNDGYGHALLGLSLLQQDKHAESLREADQAVGLEPGDSFPHYIRALVLHGLERYRDAEAAATEAVRLNPGSADHHYVLGLCRLSRGHNVSALEAAETGLQLDPDHIGCNNLRAMVLVRLGRKEEAGATIDAALGRDPNNAFSHANQGWTLLHGNQPRRALDHFREALRLDPENEWARRGIVEALKARNPVYRLMLLYFLWMARVGHRKQFALLIGAWVLAQAVNVLSMQSGILALVLDPVLVAYVGFVFLTWIAQPLFDLMLRLNRFGRHALSRDQTVAANFAGVLVLGALVPIGLAVFGLIPFWSALRLGSILLAMIVPIHALYHQKQFTLRRRMAMVIMVLTIVVLIGFCGNMPTLVTLTVIACVLSPALISLWRRHG